MSAGNTGHRMLAAIVFTDVVGYTVLAGRDEGKAIQLFRRDADLITQTCKEYDGQVLKNTGDGLLMCFSSAVQAVSCSIEIQQRLHNQNMDLPKEEVFMHRIGVHLGDVVLMEDDVIGDGVNIANRLQNEARPGGIALSQTVYDVVKNKVKLNATSLGVRNLKHIVEPVMVWSIPPIGTPGQGLHSPTPAQEELLAAPMAFEEPKPDGARGIVLVVGAIFVLAIPLALFLWARNQPEPKAKSTQVVATNDKGAKSDTSSDKTDTKDGDNGDTKSNDNGSSDTTPPKNDQESKDDDSKAAFDLPSEQEDAPINELIKKDPPLGETLAAYRKTYDFAGAVKWLDEQGYAETPAGRAVKERYEALAAFRAWLESQLEAATAGEPLIISPPNAAPVKAWAGDGGTFQVADERGVQTMTIPEVPPESLIRIARAALVQNQPGDNKRPKIVVRRWMGVFVRTYGLNEKQP